MVITSYQTKRPLAEVFGFAAGAGLAFVAVLVAAGFDLVVGALLISGLVALLADLADVEPAFAIVESRGELERGAVIDTVQSRCGLAACPQLEYQHQGFVEK